MEIPSSEEYTHRDDVHLFAPGYSSQLASMRDECEKPLTGRSFIGRCFLRPGPQNVSDYWNLFGRGLPVHEATVTMRLTYNPRCSCRSFGINLSLTGLIPKFWMGYVRFLRLVPLAWSFSERGECEWTEDDTSS
jgi:hypothetical protein